MWLFKMRLDFEVCQNAHTSTGFCDIFIDKELEPLLTQTPDLLLKETPGPAPGFLFGPIEANTRT